MKGKVMASLMLIASASVSAATVREAFKMRHTPIDPGQMHIALVAAFVAGVTALVSTAFLMRYFRKHDSWAMSPFAWYCMVVGGASFLVFHFAG